MILVLLSLREIQKIIESEDTDHMASAWNWTDS